MSYPGITATKFGRVQCAPPPRYAALAAHDGGPLRETAWQVPIPVLDQEDLLAQGVDTAALVPGAQQVDALGSCTCNAGAGHVAERYETAGLGLTSLLLPSGDGMLSLRGTAAGCEEFAIVLYHLVTDETGNPASEWPPQDCGSSGFYVASEMGRLGWAGGYRTGSGVQGALVLLQTGTVMQGGPWLNSWMTPDQDGFIDGDGSLEAVQAAVASGVAGGHETLQVGVEQLAQAQNGQVDLARTVIRCRNSWSAGWGPLAGEYLVHASTLSYLAPYFDWKQITVPGKGN